MIPTILALLATCQAPEPRTDTRELWLPPVKSVTLERAERTVGETLQAIREQTGLELQVTGVDESAKITTEWKERPVLEALHDLCRARGAGSVRVNEGRKEKGAIELDGQGALPAAVCHWKQFRIEYVDITVTTVRSLDSTNRTASLTLSWTGQPGTHPLSVDGFKPEEIVDDQGWSLLTADGGFRRRRFDENLKEGEDPNAVLHEDRFRGGPERRNLQIELRAPAPEAKLIECFRGRLYLTFPMRFVEQSIPAAEMVAGKEIHIGSNTLRVLKFDQRGEKLTFAYKMSSRTDSSNLSYFTDFTLLDPKGNPLSRGYSGSGSDEGYTLEYTLTSATPVAKIHHQAYVGRITLAIPVELRGLPLPAKSP